MKSYSLTFSTRRLWIILIVGMIVMFGILLAVGGQIYQVKPPIPNTVVSDNGETLFTKKQIEHGQNVWQSTGGMQQGSIWGHGGYLAPDWSADWLQREAKALTTIINQNQSYDSLTETQRQQLISTAIKDEMRKNTLSDGAISVSNNRALAIRAVQTHFIALYTGDGEKSQALRKDYAFPTFAVLTPEEAHDLTAFYFWTSWAATTNRPGRDITYTSNWPHEPLVGNAPTPGILLWSIVSVFFLLAGIGAIVWYYAAQYDNWRKNMAPESGIPKTDKLAKAKMTPSMRATAKYFWLVTALFVVQILLGILTAHYAVEGQGLYGLPGAEFLPYSVSRTWHTQLAVYWIATAWLATGLYVGPLLAGKDPKFQRFGVNFLFVSLLIIVVCSFAGEWAAIHRMIDSLKTNFWFGHQGYEYVDLGRFWQIYLFIGLILWVILVLRALWPVFKTSKNRSLMLLVLVAAVAIGLLYGAGLMWGQHTNIAIMEYWRWWVVHLWVEGVFEVFATAIISLLFVQMGLVRVSTATTMVMTATIIFMFGGVLGTFHHLYFSGTPTSVIAIGAVFSALEVVPLTVIGFEAYNHHKIETQVDWEKTYHWPFMFFGAVLFWNLVGAGLFGFLINPPIALYYMQGLNTTANHGHAALFGVYGMLGLGLMLFCMRGLTDPKTWNQKYLKISFWSLNIGLAMMTFLSLLPQGMWQTYASVKHSYAYARSAEFMHTPLMEGLVWARVPGDIVFAVGVFAFALFMWKAFRNSPKRKSLT